MLKIAAGFLLPTVLHPAIAKAQMDVQKQNTVTQENAIGIHGADIKIHDNKEISDSAKNIISGIVIDEENKEALPFVSIWIEGTETGTTTDLEGRFILKVPIALISETEIKLVVSSIGYEKLFATIKTTDLPLKKKFVLKMNGCVTVGAVIVVKEVDMRPRLKGIPFVFK